MSQQVLSFQNILKIRGVQNTPTTATPLNNDIAPDQLVIKFEDLISDGVNPSSSTSSSMVQPNVISFADVTKANPAEISVPAGSESIPNLPNPTNASFTGTPKGPEKEAVFVGTSASPASQVSKVVLVGGLFLAVGAGLLFLLGDDGEAPKQSTQTAISTPSSIAKNEAPADEAGKLTERPERPNQTSAASEQRTDTIELQKADGRENTEPAMRSPTKAPAERVITAENLLVYAQNSQWEAFQSGVSLLSQKEKPSRGDRQKARRLYDNGLLVRFENPRQALELITAASIADPADPEISDSLGLVMRERGEFKKSEKHLINVITHWPDRSTAWVNLAETLSRLNENERTVAALVAAYRVSRNPENVLASYRGLARDVQADPYFRENVKKAIEVIER